MAEALKKPGAAAEADQQADPGKLPTKTVVTKLAANVQALQKKITSLTGEKGAAMKAASDNDNVHKKAFKAALAELNMDPDERANYQRHLAKYRQQLDIELQGDLLKDGDGKGKAAAR